MALRQFFIAGTDDNLPTSDSEWVNLNCADITWFGLTGWRSNHSPTSFTAKNLRVKLTNAPGTGKSYTFTFYGGTGDALTCTISDDETEGSDLVHTKTVTAGSDFEMQCTPSGTPNTSQAKFTVELLSDNTVDSIISGGTASAWDTGATDFNNISGHSTPDNTENLTEMLVSRSGTISKLYVRLTGSPGTGDSYTFTVRKNGDDTVLTVTIAGSASSGSDTEHSFAVVAGDRLTMEIVPSGSPSSRGGRYGVVFTSATANEYTIPGGTGDDASATEYNHLHGADVTWHGTLANRAALVQAPMVLKDLYVRLNTAPGVGDTRTFTLMVNEVASDLAVTISGTDTTGNNTSNVVLSTGDEVSLRHTETGSPAGSASQWAVTVSTEVPPAVEGMLFGTE